MQEQDWNHVRWLIAREARRWPATSYLARLSETTRQSLLKRGHLRRFERGAHIVHEGERGTEVFLLLSACAKTTARNDNGTEALLSIRVGGDIIGELAVMDGERRSATVTACRIDPSVAVAVDGDEFLSFLKQSAEASALLSEAISRRLRWANRRRIDFGGCSVKVRTARIIVELASTYGRQLPYSGTSIGANLSQGEFATLVGASVPSVQKALRELRVAGLIDTGYRTMTALDLPGLRGIAKLAPQDIASF